MLHTTEQWIEEFRRYEEKNLINEATRLFECLPYTTINSDAKEIELLICKYVSGNQIDHIINPAHIVFAVKSYIRICKADTNCIDKMYKIIMLKYTVRRACILMVHLAESYIEYKEKNPQISTADGPIFFKSILSLAQENNEILYIEPCISFVHAIAITGNVVLFNSIITRLNNNEVTNGVRNSLQGTLKVWNGKKDIDGFISNIRTCVDICENKFGFKKTTTKFKFVPKGGFFSMPSHKTVFRKIKDINLIESIWEDSEEEKSVYNAVNCENSSMFYVAGDESCNYYPKAKMELKK